jgi:hypothetical protein
MRSSLNFKNEYSTDNTNINSKNNINTVRVIGNEKNYGYIAASQAHSKNIRKEGKYKIINIYKILRIKLRIKSYYKKISKTKFK